MPFPATAHLFCRVIDNFGDIGVCWRLARQLSVEHGVAVTLWVDELVSFRRLCPQVDVAQDRQIVAGIAIRHWRPNCCEWVKEKIPDLVIEAFACDLPDEYVRAMAQCQHKPVWINLEYLSAENWVEGCHGLPSPHPSLPLIKYFFFPGFSSATGGLLRERGLLPRRDAFQADAHQKHAFLTELGVKPATRHKLVSLFCYSTAPVQALFSAWMQSGGGNVEPVLCLVPEGVAADDVSHFLQQPACAGASATRGHLTVQVIPFLVQPDYDKLLWSCDLNLVRGEDSVVRAQWAGQPFIWQIYPQQDDAHWSKLNAFFARYSEGLPAEVQSVLGATWHRWNGAPDQVLDWQEFRQRLPELQSHTREWALRQQANGDLASNLLWFAKKIG